MAVHNEIRVEQRFRREPATIHDRKNHREKREGGLGDHELRREREGSPG
eukprot:CAMPEP_0171576506 /NCGR_PEP_ID=MMETSP0961-20121227/6652_1 /TAXON_ID=87120 /ORGANISM="Aurantiochytrium limacinum, Strain ATCCMYA-1381" /LENGTH=48 /DNA_ID= /DNA_START= /DNA_END= /DNA_ORIENTATION=